MTPLEFKTLTEREVFAQMLKDTNELWGQSKASSLFISLFSTVRCRIESEQSDFLEGPFKKLQLEDLIESVTTNIEGDDIVFRFFYKNEKHLKHLNRIAVKYPMYFTYQYFKHIQSLLSMTSTEAHQAAMFRIVKDCENPFYLIDLANTYAVNAQVHKMLSFTGHGKKWEQVKDLIKLYPNDRTLTTQAQILADMAQNKPKLIIKKAKGKYNQVITPDLTYITEEKIPAKEDKSFRGAQSIAKQDRSLVAVANQLRSSISSSTKGTSIGELFCQVFDEQKVDVLWFDKIKKTLETQIYHKTQSGFSSWENLSSTYRHIYSAPITKNTDKKVKMVVSIDQSGSFHTESLQKIMGLLKSKSKQIAEIHVIHHTTDVIGQWHLKHDEDIQLDKMFRTALGTRSGTGGTSHKEVFKKIEKLSLQDPEQWVYICVSDMYSDIESVINKYPVMNKITKVWCKDNDGRTLNPKIVKGLHVSLP